MKISIERIERYNRISYPVGTVEYPDGQGGYCKQDFHDFSTLDLEKNLFGDTGAQAGMTAELPDTEAYRYQVCPTNQLIQLGTELCFLCDNDTVTFPRMQWSGWDEFGQAIVKCPYCGDEKTV